MPDELAGQGVASGLALAALNYAKDHKYLIALMCPFVSGFVEKHPEWYELYDGEYHERFRKPRRP
ncbi:N-acetyltransferase [Crocinitomicaceae bacterium]|nr:N-acetyltransferase [Crocinitomicaceae bacterium]MDB3906138.1 N-acetyltransferase [Crocinitomicaceae bacterium]